jgi:hypothetical protein
MCMIDCATAIFFPHPAAHELDLMGPRGKTVSERVIRLKHKRTFDERETVRCARGHASVCFGKRAQNKIVGIETFRPLALYLLDLCSA